ncbi:hypothetical protein A3K73_02385 [Candidatus Pacearchaeota archaeon RBG_13_36_9]|nr:MAG: hypothetical protein A3K73_02385 [Candidatus Pacearchaeota archaeon RBG_13_36_9]
MISHFFSFFSCIGNVRVSVELIKRYGRDNKEWEICMMVYTVENKKVYKKRCSENPVFGTGVAKRWY